MNHMNQFKSIMDFHINNFNFLKSVNPVWLQYTRIFIHMCTASPTRVHQTKTHSYQIKTRSNPSFKTRFNSRPMHRQKSQEGIRQSNTNSNVKAGYQGQSLRNAKDMKQRKIHKYNSKFTECRPK